MIVIILSDIHGNLSAMQTFLDYTEAHLKPDACVFLGDLIDYGMHSNEVVRLVRQMPYPIICNLYGNHEQAIITEDYSHFSSQRGKQCARYTKTVLNENSLSYLTSYMQADGRMEWIMDGKRYLAVHGSLEDIFWKSIRPDQDLSIYRAYDYVFSGHSHIPHCFEEFYQVDDPKHRNKKKTIFINPGSLGQPRNLCPMAQFAILDTKTEEVFLKKLSYDIQKEQHAYNGQVDEFYKQRLEIGV